MLNVILCDNGHVNRLNGNKYYTNITLGSQILFDVFATRKFYQ